MNYIYITLQNYYTFHFTLHFTLISLIWLLDSFCIILYRASIMENFIKNHQVSEYKYRCDSWLQIKHYTWGQCSFIFVILFLVFLLCILKGLCLPFGIQKGKLKLAILTSFSHFPHFPGNSASVSSEREREHCYIVHTYVCMYVVEFSLYCCWDDDVVVSLSNCHFALYNNCSIQHKHKPDLACT